MPKLRQAAQNLQDNKDVETVVEGYRMYLLDGLLTAHDTPTMINLQAQHYAIAHFKDYIDSLITPTEEA